MGTLYQLLVRIGVGQPGHVKISGELWPALTEDGTAVPVNTLVVVTALRSTTLIVRPAPPKSTPTA